MSFYIKADQKIGEVFLKERICYIFHLINVHLFKLKDSVCRVYHAFI